MVFQCRDKNCIQSFSTTYNRNKHERNKGHAPQLQDQPKIICIENLYHCPTNGCTIKSKYKANIVKHLKVCVESEKKREKNKTCTICGKVFVQKSNRDRHIQNTHRSLQDDVEEEDVIEDTDDMQNHNLPSMAYDDILNDVIADDSTLNDVADDSTLNDIQPPVILVDNTSLNDDQPLAVPADDVTMDDKQLPVAIVDSAPLENFVIPENPGNSTNQNTLPLPINFDVELPNENENKKKQSRLEKTLCNIKMQLDYLRIRECHQKVKKRLKEQQKGSREIHS